MPTRHIYLSPAATAVYDQLTDTRSASRYVSALLERHDLEVVRLVSLLRTEGGLSQAEYETLRREADMGNAMATDAILTMIGGER